MSTAAAHPALPPSPAGWHRGPLLAFDLETTGVDPHTARIVSGTLVSIAGGDFRAPGWLTLTREWLVNPGVEIPAAAAAIHGISNERVRANGLLPGIALPQMLHQVAYAAAAGIPIIGHNVSYDLTVLHAEALRWGYVPATPKNHRLGWVIDTLVVDRQMDPNRRGKRTLEVTCAHYGVPLLSAHDATADAVAAARIAVVMAEKYPALAALNVEELHMMQKQWKREQALSTAEWLRTREPGAVVDDRWPVAF